MGKGCGVYHVVTQARQRTIVLASTRPQASRVVGAYHMRIGRVVMGAFLRKVCSGPTNPLLSLNDTCQRLRCLMACCGGSVNVTTRGDGTDAAVQTDEEETKETSV